MTKCEAVIFIPEFASQKLSFSAAPTSSISAGKNIDQKQKNTRLIFFETVLNVGFRKVCSGTCVVCGLSAGDLDCLVFNRAFFAVTILVNAT